MNFWYPSKIRMCLRYIATSRFRKWKFSVILGGILLLVFVRAISNALRPEVLPLTELDKCPVCYGRSICHEIINGNVKITPFGLYSAIAHLIGSKNVFFGTLGENRVVLKKLARSYELKAFDDTICANKSLASQICPRLGGFDRKYEKNVDFRTMIAKTITSSFLMPDVSSLRLCPSSTNIDKLFENVYANDKDYKRVYQWTLININPEPLVMQILPAEQGWPVPKYLGACGRLIIQEYVGFPLTTYYYEPWILRAKIASSLLGAAQMLTFRNPDFGFYLTDLSPDNIAITPDNEAKFIDLENIIIVDKNVSAEDQSESWSQMQVNEETIECRNCLAFSPGDICDHQLSDHNYYAICQHILSDKTSATSFPGGFLHSVPKHILDKYENLIHILDQCAVPIFLPYKRISFGDELKNILDKIVKDTG